MKGLGTVFKEVYGKELEPYGFKKIKGRQPYFVRLVGDEIIHVITYQPGWVGEEGYRGFFVAGGVATVYRPKIDLDETPSHSNWIKHILSFYRYPYYEEKPDMFNEWYRIKYKIGDEASIYDAFNYSLDSVKQVILPIFDEVSELKKVDIFFRKYKAGFLKIYNSDELFGMSKIGNEDNEGLLELKLFSVDEYMKLKKTDRKETMEKNLYLYKSGKTSWTPESFKKSQEEYDMEMNEAIEKFVHIKRNSIEMKKVMEELERRKKINIECLRKYGIV